MIVRNWRSTFTAFWMLAAESVPVLNVSRPSAIGRSKASSVRTVPSGFNSAISMRIPLAPMSMTERTGIAVGIGSATHHHHRLQAELVSKEVALVHDRQLVQRHVAACLHLQPKLRAARLGLHGGHALAMVVIQRVRDAQDRGQGADALLALLVQVPVALVAEIRRRLPVVSGDVRDHEEFLVAQP